MNIPMTDLSRIATGDITLAFRRWRRPTVKAGGTLTTAVGVLAIDTVERIDPVSISDAQARQAGYADRATLLVALNRRSEGDLYRIGLHLAGADPRIALRDRRPDATDLEQLVARLARLDRAAPAGPWTGAVLALIAANEATRAADLAPRLGFDRDDFKRQVRKLKNLGLTESLEVGYRLSPRGRALHEHLAGR